MRKCLYLFLALVLIYSCKRQSSSTKNQSVAKKSVSTRTVTTIVKFNNPILSQYQEFINSLDTNDMTTSTKAAEKFSALFEGQDQNTCDTAFTIFDKYYDRLASVLDDIHQKDTVNNYDKYLLYKDSLKHLPQKIKQNMDKLEANGFMITVSEGTTYITEDQDFVAKWFYHQVSPAMKEYLTQLNKESKDIIEEDASILIDSKELVDITIWWEKFAKNNPHFLLHKEAQNNFSGSLEILLEGTDNSPVWDTESNKLAAYFKEAYEYAESKYPSTETAQKVAPYYNFLLQGKKASADSLLKVYLTNR